MFVRPEQPENAELPMVVTLSGMVMFVRPEQPENAELPIVVTLDGMVVVLQPAISVLVEVSIIALQLSLLSYFEFPASTCMLVSPVQ